MERAGRIIFGVDDVTREVVGIPNDIVFSEIDAITAAISDSCEPVVIPDVYLQTIDDKTIIIAEISPGRQAALLYQVFGNQGWHLYQSLWYISSCRA